jgi:hypothetical protein
VVPRATVANCASHHGNFVVARLRQRRHQRGHVQDEDSERLSGLEAFFLRRLCLDDSRGYSVRAFTASNNAATSLGPLVCACSRQGVLNESRAARRGQGSGALWGRTELCRKFAQRKRLRCWAQEELPKDSALLRCALRRQDGHMSPTAAGKQTHTWYPIAALDATDSRASHAITVVQSARVRRCAPP